ncbi:hypothetical protein [Luteitalea sp.]|uniref:hypothetical protein n=1 Tax=Luteitalea sp. TaxID=2004800 RepID=UPI0025C6582D|nr:hypothetical protein [Luteitalea sp.]
MTRRGALAIVAATIGAWVRGAEASQRGMVDRAAISVVYIEPLPLHFDLDGFKEFRISHAGRVLVLTPAELFAALQPEGDPPR